jgi:hypothetical protein
MHLILAKGLSREFEDRLGDRIWSCWMFFVALPLVPAFNVAISTSVVSNRSSLSNPMLRCRYCGCELDSTLCFSRTYDLIARNEATHTQANEYAGSKIPGHAGGILILMRNDVTFCLG